MARPADLLAVLLPSLCIACRQPAGGGAALCTGCANALAAAPSPVAVGVRGIEPAMAAGPYRGVHRDLCHALKYHRTLSAARLGAELIATAAAPDVLTGCLVPVPAAPRRRLTRGFDSAEELAVCLAAHTGLRLRQCLRRSDGPRQVGRGRAARLAGPPGVRLAGRPPRRAVLVDDVVTTGATIAACASALRAGGSEAVAAVALAASRRPRLVPGPDGA